MNSATAQLSPSASSGSLARLTVPVLGAAAVAALFCAPLCFPSFIPLRVWWDPASCGVDGAIFLRYRLPRVCLAFLVGSGLGVGGLAFQSMFRNPLATPFTLGVSGGAALGAALYIVFGFSFVVAGVTGSSLFAFLGALGTVLLVYGLARLKRGFSVLTMLLAGVAVSWFCSGLILFLQYLSDFHQTFRLIRWLMGELEGRRFENVLNVLPFAVVGAAAVLAFGRELNLLTTGEDLAAARGVAVRRTQLFLFFAVSLMVGGITAVCGPIGFVGLMSPHVCRLLVGPNHRRLTPATLLFGGTFLVLCDALARTVIAPVEIPVGVLTALLGGPFFLWLLLSGKEEHV